MVSVEAPETTCPALAHWPSARAQGERIDAPMAVEPLVLVGDEHLQVARVDLIGRDRQAPGAVACGERRQQPPVAVDDQGRSIRQP